MTLSRVLVYFALGAFWLCAVTIVLMFLAELATSRGWPKPGRTCPICGQPDDATHTERHP